MRQLQVAGGQLCICSRLSVAVPAVRCCLFPTTGPQTSDRIAMRRNSIQPTLYEPQALLFPPCLVFPGRPFRYGLRLRLSDGRGWQAQNFSGASY
ncbi:hypothetical protein B0H63DRAFT_474531 [Podospora didyma]|uniref:Uncharacterized protein n=1 Tax=Podospora didyma TaxID=330526 RepID=A0AAE0NG63_9PEZI|nr:hypothetical protein B0H63DRAFT_474531 [Podospora didyma]